MEEVDELLGRLGSLVAELTVAEFETEPLVAETVTTSTTVAFAPFARVPREHVTVVVPEHVPWDGVAETNVIPAGSASVMTTLVAALGPAFAMAMLYVILPFGAKDAGPVFVTERSACGVTVVVEVAVLLAKLGSGVGEPLAVAVLVIVPVVSVLVTTRVIVLVPPLLMAPSEQVTVVVPEHVPCDGVTDTNVSPPGNVSVRMTLGAGLGPPLVTVMV